MRRSLPEPTTADTALNEKETPDALTFSLARHPSSDSARIIIDSLMEVRQDHEIIQVISYYAETESYSGNEENLGIERAMNIMSESAKQYSDQNLQPVGLLFKGDSDTTGISTYVKIEKTDRRKPIRILEDNRVLIFFPYASSNEMAVSEITGVIDSLSSIWKTEKCNLLVSGHTDNDASETTNYNLGLNRAQSVQEKIVQSGFPPEKITTLSRGEKEPISTNLTPYGRYLNRRVEIYPFK